MANNLIIPTPSDGDTSTIVATNFTSKLQEAEDYMPARPVIPAENPTASRFSICVTNQGDISSAPTLRQKILTASMNYDVIDVIFDKGTYFAANEMIEILDTGYNFQGKTINIYGNGSTLIPSSAHDLRGEGYENGYCKFSLPTGSIPRADSLMLLDADYNFITDFYGEMKVAKGLIEMRDTNTENCTWPLDDIPVTSREPIFRIPTDEEDMLETGQDVYVQIYMWYYSRTFRVLKIQNHWIYAKAISTEGISSEYHTTYNQWPQNLHYAYGRHMPLYRLINKPFSSKAFFRTNRDANGSAANYTLYCKCSNIITLCNSNRIIHVKDSRLAALNISGFHFLGSGEIDSASTSLIRVRNSQNVNIQDCKFTRIGGNAIELRDTENIIIRGNEFEHYYRHGIYVEKCKRVLIEHNKLHNGNLYQSNNYAIRCIASDYHILHNTIRNYGYSAIAVGLAHSASWSEEVSGVIEYNDIYQDPEYRNSLANVPLMDSGAIYTFTQNTKTVIRHNFISGHAALKDGRGIFCDDGTENASIFGNMVINTRNSWCIDLYFRNPYSSPGSNNYNKNNLFLYNIIDGACRFQGRGGDSAYENYKGRNFYLTERAFSPLLNNYSDVNQDQKESDFILSGCKVEEAGIAIPHSNSVFTQSTIYPASGDRVVHLSEFILSHIRSFYY